MVVSLEFELRFAISFTMAATSGRGQRAASFRGSICLLPQWADEKFQGGGVSEAGHGASMMNVRRVAEKHFSGNCQFA